MSDLENKNDMRIGDAVNSVYNDPLYHVRSQDLSEHRLGLQQTAMLQLQEVELIDGERMMFVEVELNGSFHRLLLDTGACVTTLATDCNDWLESIAEETDKVVIGFYGYEEKLRVAEVHIGLGELTLERQVNLIKAMPTSELFAELGLPAFHGILGNDLLRELKAKIDYSSGFLCLTL